MPDLEILQGDCLAVLRVLPSESVQTCITSPPYWGLRDYGVDGQIGLEASPDEFVATMVAVFREVRRVLRHDGTLWINLGDSYAGARGGGQGQTGLMADRSVAAQRCRVRGDTRNVAGLKGKDLVGIPWRVAFALQADGWYLRSDIIWAKPNPMPESITDRPTKSHEYVFLLAKSERYYYNADAIKEPVSGTAYARGKGTHPKSAAPGSGIKANESFSAAIRDLVDERNKRSVWTIPTRPFDGAHFATYPPDLVKPCVLAGSRPGDTVLDPFNGAGTTGLVAIQHHRRYIGIELNPEYIEITRRRLARIPLRLPMEGA